MKRPVLPARLIWWRRRPILSRVLAVVLAVLMPVLYWWDFFTLGFEEANEQSIKTYKDAVLVLFAKRE